MRKLLSVLVSTLQGGVRGGLLFVALFTTTCLWAYDFQVGDLYYNITSSSAPYTIEVTYQDMWSTNNYPGLTTATIPDTVIHDGTTYSVTSIGERAFYDCSSLTSVTIPNSVTSIGNAAFQHCSSLTSVTIPNSVTSIGNAAFLYCSSITSITIPNSVTSIGIQAFYDCDSLTSVTIGNSVTSIGNNAFYNCDSLTKTNYTGDIAGWCKIKFEGGSANPISNSHNLYINDQEIQDLVIPNTVDSIQNYAFYECFSLNSVTIPNSVKSIGYSTFQHCCFLKKDFVNNSSLDAEEKGYWGALVGESEIDGLIIQGTTVVGCRKNVTNVTIPDYITNIGSYAFSYCSSLTSITIPYSVTSIGSYAFSNCDSLTKTNYTGDIADWCNIKFDSSRSNPMFYSQNLYINDQEIKDLVIPNSVDSIHDYTFYNGSALSSVSLSNSVTSIGNYAFSDCSSLTSVIIPNSVTSIGNGAFEDCSSLTSITIPNSVTNIGYWAFQYTGIYNDESNWENNELYIDDCLIEIKYNSLTGSYTIKDGVRLIAGGAFWNQDGLTEVTIPNSVKSISTRAFSGTEITSIAIPNSVTNIEQMTFYNCRNLSSVTLGSGLTCIEDRVFDCCTTLASINIPKGVSSVGKWAFRQCSSLDTIILNSNIPPTLDYTAFQNAAQPICYVPCGTSAEYQASSWVSYVDTLVEVCYTKLFYTSTDGAIVTPDNTAFGAKIVDNTYSNGQGVITFDRPILTIKQSAFNSCDNLATIMIPKTVTEIEDYAFEDCSTLSSITLPNNITTIGKGTFSGCSALTEIAIPNSVTYIGESAFEDCVRLGKVQIGSGVETIAENAFAGCTRLYDVYCYATYPPFAEQSSFANYNVYLYVPCESIRNYTLDVVWGNFKFIECIESEDVTTEGVVVTPSTNDVTITWPTETGAESYTIVIKKGDTVFCTLTFNADGQLLNIAFAPGRDGNHPAQYAEQAGNGYRFTVTGLEEGTHYAYNIDVRDAANTTIKSHIGEFTTESTTPVENTHIPSPMTNCQKLLRDNQLLILRDGNTYNVMGVIVE